MSINRAAGQRLSLLLFRQALGLLIVSIFLALLANLIGGPFTIWHFGLAISLWAGVEWLHVQWVRRSLQLDSARDPSATRIGPSETFWIDLGGPNSRTIQPSRRRFAIPTQFAWLTLRENEIEFAITEYGKRVSIRWDLGERATFHFLPFETTGKRFLWLCRVDHTCPRIVSPLWISGGNLERLEQAVRRFGYPAP